MEKGRGEEGANNWVWEYILIRITINAHWVKMKLNNFLLFVTIGFNDKKTIKNTTI